MTPGGQRCPGAAVPRRRGGDARARRGARLHQPVTVQEQSDRPRSDEEGAMTTVMSKKQAGGAARLRRSWRRSHQPIDHHPERAAADRRRPLGGQARGRRRSGRSPPRSSATATSCSSAVILWRRADETTWREAPMTLVNPGLDRGRGSIRLDRQHHLRLYRSRPGPTTTRPGRASLEKKVADGQTVDPRADRGPGAGRRCRQRAPGRRRRAADRAARVVRSRRRRAPRSG